MHLEKFLKFRKEYPEFIYHSYTIEEKDKTLDFSFEFEIVGLSKFNPTWSIDKLKVIEDKTAIENLVFSIGMVELISYWKITCSPKVIIEAGALNKKQIKWWKNEYFHGLGEFFYVNNIETHNDFNQSFMNIEAHGKKILSGPKLDRNKRVLIPIGGGKDSIVTIDLLKEMDCTGFIINPRGATYNTFNASNLSSLITARRTLDKNMLDLNSKGYLNGHTPFSAIVAFSSVLAACINGISYVALSNEFSANESTIPGTKVNHQYSKSYEFECAFREYEENYLGSNIYYFSMLRPFSEMQIAKYFSSLSKYHEIFRSCNVGSKEDKWCGHCPKCLFVYIILSPFLTEKELINIFGKNLLHEESLLNECEKLIGIQPEKPFECVGSRDEVITSLKYGFIKHQEKFHEKDSKAEDLPVLLGKCGAYAFIQGNEIYDYWKIYEENALPENFAEVAKKKMEEKGAFTPIRQKFSKLKDKKILILGYGREGRSTYNFLKSINIYDELAIADNNTLIAKEDIKATLYLGENYLNAIDEYDIIFKSPGIKLPRAKSTYKGTITSQTEIFMELFSHQIIGITGTKGKSTTSSMLHHILRENGIDSLLVGNIGIPVFDIIDHISPASVIVFELSCHQLEHLKISPTMAILLNLFEDHLDRYGDFESYVNAKKNIFKYQKSLDTLYCNEDILPRRNEFSGKLISINKNFQLKDFSLELLEGKHNIMNIAFVYEVCKFFNINDEDFIYSITTFKPLPHRLEYIGTLNGVDYYDDSISTTAESAINAIKSVENIGTIILGGMDRGIEYTGLIEFILQSSLKEVILLYDSGERILNELGSRQSNIKFTYMNSLEEASEYLKNNPRENTACILSPASASYGHFNGFEDRGNKFKKYIFG
ncbi:MAG: UDP-N-acetylmuramoyl-L-alanine--D-glutamate ligase [Lachnospirales bacterium]